MIATKVALYFLLLYVIIISGEEFCERDRKLLLGGVFNFDQTLFAYSWKEANSVQLWLIWKYDLNGKELTPIGTSSTVDQLFAGVPLFRAGFGLNLKCTEDYCKKYKDLVFIFFQNSYKVFRYANDKFTAESDAKSIPWNLKPKGDVSEWFFGNSEMDNINGIAFVAKKIQIFLVSKNGLYTCVANVRAAGLKWLKLDDNNELPNVLGGFVSGTEIFFNKNESPNNILMKYDETGKQLAKISVWKYFNCETSKDVALRDKDDILSEEPLSSDNSKDKKIVIIVFTTIFIITVLTNVIAGAFWISVYRKNKKDSSAE